jgi:hypothetical protein
MMFRSVKDFDWAKELKELIPGVTEARHGGQVVYKIPKDGSFSLSLGGGKELWFYTPDGRTVVFATEEDLDRLFERKPGGNAPAWAADFKRIERGIAAVVIDNRNAAVSRELAARDKQEAAFVSFLTHTAWVVAGVSADKDLVCAAAAHFDGEEIASKAVKGIDGWLAGAHEAFLQPSNYWQAAFEELLQKPELTRDGATVHLRCRSKCDITEVLNSILGGELGQ